MRVGILGSGAMGCLVGGLLAQTSNDVLMFDADPLTVRSINTNGVQIDQAAGLVSASVRAYGPQDDLEPVDLLIVLVKAARTGDALAVFRRAVNPHTQILSLQNGLGNLETIHEIFPQNPLLAGTTAQASRWLAPGLIRHTGSGKTMIGPYLNCSDENSKAAASMLSDAGIETAVSRDINHLIWSKLMINAVINPLTAILGVTNGFIAEDAGIQKTVRSIVEETVAVAKSLGLDFEVEEQIAKCLEVSRQTFANQSSMLQDIRFGRETEIRAINGAIADAGENAGIGVPVNRLLSQLVIARESLGRSQPPDQP